MADRIIVCKTEDGGTVRVNATLINDFIDQLAKESAIERLKRCGERLEGERPKAAPSRKHELAL